MPKYWKTKPKKKKWKMAILIRCAILWCSSFKLVLSSNNIRKKIKPQSWQLICFVKCNCHIGYGYMSSLNYTQCFEFADNFFNFPKYIFFTNSPQKTPKSFFSTKLQPILQTFNLTLSKAPRTHPTLPSPPHTRIRVLWLGSSLQNSRADSGGTSWRSTTYRQN